MGVLRFGITLGGMALILFILWNLRHTLPWLNNPILFVGLVILLAGGFSILQNRL
jgi:hypothetical protein